LGERGLISLVRRILGRGLVQPVQRLAPLAVGFQRHAQLVGDLGVGRAGRHAALEHLDRFRAPISFQMDVGQQQDRPAVVRLAGQNRFQRFAALFRVALPPTRFGSQKLGVVAALLELGDRLLHPLRGALVRAVADFRARRCRRLVAGRTGAEIPFADVDSGAAGREDRQAGDGGSSGKSPTFWVRHK
jgi:hypothetical protein